VLIRASKLYMPTLKQVPKEAHLASHQLMLRGGFLHTVAAGIYSFLPLGLRIVRRIEHLVRVEMDARGGQEVLLPVVMPAELWQQSGRWTSFGPELAKFTDRTGREFCLGPTHEEAIVDLVRGKVNSYRQLPLLLYQIHTKYRDEPRPRGGLIRTREFIMKDAYSFHATPESLDETFQSMYDAYAAVFDKLEWKYRVAEASAGSIGGKETREFILEADSGEDFVLTCDACGYTANVEVAERKPVARPKIEPTELSKVATPGKRTIEEVSGFLKVAPARLVKTLLYHYPGGFVAALVPGDSDLNEDKLKRVLDTETLRLAEPDEILHLTGAPVGFSGPVGLQQKAPEVKILADYDLEGAADLVTGANEADAHLVGVAVGRDFQVDAFCDLRNAAEGDSCPRCGAPMKGLHGIEVGHLFKLGTIFSEPMGATFVDESGKEQPILMGCYGMGITRIAAAAAEVGHDDQGLIWPRAIAPFDCVVLQLDVKDAKVKDAAETVAGALEAEGWDVLLDDRDLRPGAKFKDADLIGVPCQVVVGKRFLETGKFEVRARDGKDLTKVSALVEAVAEGLQ